MVIGRSHSIKDHPGLTGLMLISAVAGAVTAIFTTPRTGYESRTRIKERGRRMRDRLQEYMREDSEGPDLGDMAAEARAKAAETARKAKQDTAEKANEAKEAAKSAASKTRSNNSKEGKP